MGSLLTEQLSEGIKVCSLTRSTWVPAVWVCRDHSVRVCVHVCLVTLPEPSLNTMDTAAKRKVYTTKKMNYIILQDLTAL